MTTETDDTQAEDTAILMELDEKVNKRVQECLNRILTEDDDLAEWFIRSIINHPKTTKVIREIYSREKEKEILDRAQRSQYEEYVRQLKAQQLGQLSNKYSYNTNTMGQTTGNQFFSQEEIDYQIKATKT